MSDNGNKGRISGWRLAALVVCVITVILSASTLIVRLTGGVPDAESHEQLHSREQAVFLKRASGMKHRVLGAKDKRLKDLNPVPNVGYVVFISVSDGNERARVFSASGESLAAAWRGAVESAGAYVGENSVDSKLIKADVVVNSRLVSAAQLSELLNASDRGDFRFGVAFDSEYGTALLEQEMNGNGIYDYDADDIDLGKLNSYLISGGRETLMSIPEELRLFTCRSWFEDEDGGIIELSSEGSSYGHRDVGGLSAEDAASYAAKGIKWFKENIREDGSFLRGLDLRSGAQLEGYNMTEHATVIWALITEYESSPDEELKAVINSAVERLFSNVYWTDKDSARVGVQTDDCELGSNGIAIALLTEYMKVFGSNDYYTNLCTALGRGLMQMQEPGTGVFYEEAGNDTNEKREAFAHYVGAAAFAYGRLYGLTGSPEWLAAARLTADHMVNSGYNAYADCWVTLAIDELTSHLADERFYTFALKTAQENLYSLTAEEKASPDKLRMLMSVLKLMTRAEEGREEIAYLVTDFDKEAFAEVVRLRAARVLDGYIWPETAMYFADPAGTAGTFMCREKGPAISMDNIAESVLAMRGYAEYSPLLSRPEPEENPGPEK